MQCIDTAIRKLFKILALPASNSHSFVIVCSYGIWPKLHALEIIIYTDILSIFFLYVFVRFLIPIAGYAPPPFIQWHDYAIVDAKIET